MLSKVGAGVYLADAFPDQEIRQLMIAMRKSKKSGSNELYEITKGVIKSDRTGRCIWAVGSRKINGQGEWSGGIGSRVVDMRWVSGRIITLTKGITAALIAVPVVALALGGVVDRGARGEVAATPFHLALAVFDPFLWVCARNSLAVALGVSAGSLVLGVPLARLAVRWRFWGRRVWLVPGCSALAVPPLFGALGLTWFLERSGLAILSTRTAGGVGGWLALVWTGLIAGVPLVALASSAVLARTRAEWYDAARLEGASPRRVWWSLIWPLVRPEAARAAARVFVLNLLEPGAPRVLGLRRTLSFQVVEAALGPDSLPRAAAVGVLGVTLAWLGRTLIHGWGRAVLSSPLSAPHERTAQTDRAPWFRAAVLTALGVGWTVVALSPIAGLVAGAVGPGVGESAKHGIFAWIDPEALTLLVHSLVLGLAVGGLNLLLALGLAAGTVGRPSGAPGRSVWSKAGSPLAVGIGVLCVPWLLDAAADLFAVDSALIGVFRVLAEAFDPYRSPILPLVWALAVVRLPILRQAAESALEESRPVLIDAAVNLGASKRRGFWEVQGRGIGPALAAPLALTVALAATDAAPALVLTPTAAGRTIGPGVALLTAEPDGLQRASVLAVLAVACNLAALGFNARRRVSILLSA